MSDTPQSRLARFAPPVIMLALSAVFLAWSYAYEDESGEVPALVGWVLVALCTLDLIAAFDNPAGRAVRSFFTGSLVGGDASETGAYPPARVLAAMAWPVAFAAGIALFGFVMAIPVYVFLFVAIQGRKGMRNALYAALSITAFIYIVFELLLSYELYRGVLFA